MNHRSILPLRLQNISLAFGRKVVLRGIELTLCAGETVAILGANGAGKTSLFAIIAGLIPVDQGEICFGDHEPNASELEVRSQIGFLTHHPQLYPRLTVHENIKLFQQLHIAVGSKSSNLDEMLERMGLAGIQDQLATSLSRGQAQRLALARTLIAQPELLLLDEPFTALDRYGCAQLIEALQHENQRGAAILLCSHDLEIVSQIADRVILLENGRFRQEASRQGNANKGSEKFKTQVVQMWSGVQGEQV